MDVIKRNGNIEEFNKEKIKSSIEKASKFLNVERSTIAKATCKGFINKEISKVLPIHKDNNRLFYLIWWEWENSHA